MPLLLYILELIMSKKVVRYLIYILLVCVFAIFVFKLNQTEKTELVVRTGHLKKQKLQKSFRIILILMELVSVSRKCV